MNKDKIKFNTRSIPFKETRKRRPLALIESYTRLIATLSETLGQARICDIARTMKISHVSAIKNIKRLIREGYVIEDSLLILLTHKGREMALFSHEKHSILSNFLLNLGVPEDVVSIDVTGMQPYVSTLTLEAMAAHMFNRGLSICVKPKSVPTLQQPPPSIE